MKKHSRTLDFSIHGDELEKHRIELENNLQNTEISLRLSTPSEDDFEGHSSVEYPRHNSGPTEFRSFEANSRDHYDGESPPWLFRTYDDDDEGIDPYHGGGSLSTAAHHASALTLSAGLGGGRAGRRDISVSGAEYDPERPLQDLIAGVDLKLSMFDIEPSRSKYMGDPLVVDSTAELHRLLQTERAQSIISPLQSSSSSSESEPNQAHPKQNITTRPKLSDSLRRVSFSPQRPRSNPGSPRLSSRHLPNTSHNEPTPKPRKRSNIFPSYGTAQPQVRLQPPTPTNASFASHSQSQSQFSKLARGITREIEHAQRGEGSKQTERNPFDNSAAGNVKQHQQTPARPSAMKQRIATPGTNAKSKVHLPDITGLTSAVESPMKLGADYYVYPGSPRETEARLITTLNIVQSKLQHLEEENGISRRRVRELELELEVCKRDVARERTRVMEREEVIVQQQRDASFGASNRRKDKGKARAKDISINIDHEGLHQRYKEAVEGQKALEALITTLRSHLTRLTSELSSHRKLLMELRELRDADERTIKAKSAEVERLSREVERLGGEIEVLRGVVEEGLRERRSTGEPEVVLEASDIAMSLDSDDEGQEAHGEESRDEDEPEPFDPVSIAGLSRHANQSHTMDKTTTMRTDHATLGSSNPVPSRSVSQSPIQAQGVPLPLINSAEIERISVEMEERRSMEHHARSPDSHRPRATVQDASDDEQPEQLQENVRRPRPHSPLPPVALTVNRNSTRLQHSQTNHQRLVKAVSGEGEHQHQQQGNHRRSNPRQPMDETPFPQIRGGHLERLFFSAPEHNERTCNVCCRRRHAGIATEATWMPTRFRAAQNEEESTDEEDDDDEGFVEEEKRQHQRESNPNDWKLRAQGEGLPPQTVVARVIRELEDDFTHYKGIYVELADQYKDMDPVSDVPRRNLLAKHLREVVDVLEQKGDQIAALYDLLTFKDKPTEESAVPPNKPSTAAGKAKLGRTTSTTAIPSTSVGRSAGAFA